MNNLDHLTERIDNFTERVNSLKTIEPFKTTDRVTYEETFKEFSSNLELLRINISDVLAAYRNGIENDIDQYNYVFSNSNRLRNSMDMIKQLFRDMANDLRRLRMSYYVNSNLSKEMVNALKSICKDFPMFDKAVEDLVYIYLPDYEKLEHDTKELIKENMKLLTNHIEHIIHCTIQQSTESKIMERMAKLK